MITKINPKKFKFVKSIKFDEKVFNSSYNHSYFYDEIDNCLILETCNDDSTMFYYKVTRDDLVYLGFIESIFGIFSEYYENANNIIELNSNYY